MARPHVFVWWDEYDRRDMPCMCMFCGKNKASWVAWRFEKFVYKNARNYRRIRKTEIPLCKEHGGGAFKLKVISASDYDDEKGVWTMNVHEDFVAALRKHRKQEVQAWKAENEGADPEDLDEEKLPPGLREEPEKPVRSSTGFFFGMGFFAVIIGVVLLGFLAVCLIFGLIFGAAVMKRR